MVTDRGDPEALEPGRECGWPSSPVRPSPALPGVPPSADVEDDESTCAGATSTPRSSASAKRAPTCSPVWPPCTVAGVCIVCPCGAVLWSICWRIRTPSESSGPADRAISASGGFDPSWRSWTGDWPATPAAISVVSASSIEGQLLSASDRGESEDDAVTAAGSPAGFGFTGRGRGTGSAEPVDRRSPPEADSSTADVRGGSPAYRSGSRCRGRLPMPSARSSRVINPGFDEG